MLFGRECILIPDGNGRGHGGRPARFTLAVIVELRKQAATIPVKELAASYGVSPQRIYKLFGPRPPKPGKPKARKPRPPTRPWTVEDDLAVMRLPTRKAAAKTGRPADRLGSSASAFRGNAGQAAPVMSQ
ncbi:MAG TPA: hypothetical protein VKE40_17050 [Gemmataceae bacterium]|nr:hypothetical protein [Gemmataceae bacterium]